MPVFLVRHADAGNRDSWDGPDLLRPLTLHGRAQADGLVALIDGAGELRSSPYVRCVQTLEPLAGKLDLPVVTDERLAESASVHDAVLLVREAAASNAVLCSHGDMIPAMLDALELLDDLQLPPGYPCAKGSTWVLDTDRAGRISSARYLRPPA